MLDFIGQVAWIAAPILGLATLAGSWWALRRVVLAPRLVASGLFAAAVTWLGLVVGVQVVFRDGLGPDAVTSSGELAIARVFDGMWLGLAGALVPLLLGVWVLRRAKSRDQRI